MNKAILQEKLAFLIVDDDEHKAWDYELFASRLSPAKILMVTEGEMEEEVLFALEQIYSEGLIPFVILDENLGNEVLGSKILKEVILREHPSEGGILLAGSTMSDDQNIVLEEILSNHATNHQWILSKSDFTLKEEEILSDLQRYFDLQNDEPNVELKNN
ncbi:hypothetical protein CVU76_03655 [Candidatus Dojkabacteria bacterium HGW-Dojkabacteria-1]|uniref:Uncharacterized protein n=1 Tax=Candidatus Dojkabacteria bacterium HGW-Dojkabacteria-1 TaxID=2013761 RepID=A0A2N2F4J9_9BACT|nr:MAG: hypothetical protein CVU76_03655 [Candidatus Dojkabacteria bacterium HGW-Dojkabacteria-1]